MNKNVEVKKLKGGLYTLRTPDGVQMVVRRFPKKGTRHVIIDNARRSWRGDAWHGYWTRRDAARGRRTAAYADSLRSMRNEMAERYAMEQEVMVEHFGLEGLELDDILQDVVIGKTLRTVVGENVAYVLEREWLLPPGWSVSVSPVGNQYGGEDASLRGTVPYTASFALFRDLQTQVCSGGVFADLAPYSEEKWGDKDLMEASLLNLEVSFDAENARTLLEARNEEAKRLAGVMKK